jgi:lipopolysaccharide transport system permease protein
MTAAAGDQVVHVIRPRRGWAAIDLRELWDSRELVYFLVLRDLKVRYKQTAFGVAWALIQPLALTLVFTLFLSRASGINPTGVPYPLFALAALIPWTLFSQSLGAAANSLVENANLLTKVYFPRLLLPLAAAGSHIVDFLVGFAVLTVVSVVMGYLPTLNWLALIALTVLAYLAAIGAGLWLSAINVRYRDVRYAIPFLIQFWLFATPVAYSSAALPPTVQQVFWLNPMTGVTEAFRWAITGESVDLVGPIAGSLLVTATLLVTGAAYFRRVERTFADVV